MEPARMSIPLRTMASMASNDTSRTIHLFWRTRFNMRGVRLAPESGRAAKRRRPGNSRITEPHSLFNCLDAKLLEFLELIAHFLEPIWRVTLPVRNFADDAERISGS